jgi:hypothetical protein
VTADRRRTLSPPVTLTAYRRNPEKLSLLFKPCLAA